MEQKIYKAVSNLPEHLITPEIAEAAIAEGNIKLLDCLPKRYLTEKAVMSIVSRNEEGYCWDSFQLSNIPEALRGGPLCEFAVKKDSNNIVYVPEGLRSSEMLGTLLDRKDAGFKYLHLFRPSLWNAELVCKGIASVYSYIQNNYRYGNRRRYQTTCDIRQVQILLSFVPAAILTRKFYLNLFSAGIKAEDLEVLVPNRYKHKEYYLRMAGTDFQFVPSSYYDYDIITEAISHSELSIYQSPYKPNDIIEKYKDTLFPLIDDKLADLIVSREPRAFKCLPENFQTPARLIKAMEADNNDNIHLGNGYKHLLTEEVCKTYVRKNIDIPEFPASVWTPEFVEYCMEYGTAFRWFPQMPKCLQTREIVYKVLAYSGYHLSYVEPKLISLEQAQKLYRENNYYHEHIPKHFITEFRNETGLDEAFFGGEVSFSHLRELRGNNTYCRLGNTYVGIREEQDTRYNRYQVLVLTRRTPQAFRPVPLFERAIGTFHSTWLEKLIADNDASFVKPSVSKELKQYQFNGYYTLEKVGEESGIAIYANELLEERISYAARLDGEIITNSSLSELKDKIRSLRTIKEEDAA